MNGGHGIRMPQVVKARVRPPDGCNHFFEGTINGGFRQVQPAFIGKHKVTLHPCRTSSQPVLQLRRMRKDLADSEGRRSPVPVGCAPPRGEGRTFCHERQKVPKNAQNVTNAARTAASALSRAATAALNPFPAKGWCLGRQARFARMTQGPVGRAGV